jgi:lipopolysaccharide/colanic/teichoic acid biosynthesis glycosyltransferase
VIAAANGHAYAAASTQDQFRAIAKGLHAFLFALGIAIFAVFALKTSDTFPRLVVSLGSLLAIMSLSVGRYLFTRHLAQIIGGSPFSVVLLRDGDAPIPAASFSIIMPMDGTFDPESHDPIMYDRLATSLAHADRVIVACKADRRVAWAHALKGANIQGEIFVPELDSLAPLGIANYGNTPTLIIANGPLGLVDRCVKRAFDIALAATALFVLLPLFIVVALLIKRDSPGPVFFTQVRIGRSNQMFRMKKFRSMYVDGSDGAGHRSTGRDDDRITKVGRVIRRTSIDELPQILNVLIGDMSIVGPRPHALGSRAADKLFWEVDHRYWHRHAAKPGLTGLAQVRGYRGATLVEADLENRLQADLEYLENWSIWRDLKIILMTFRVLRHSNAF